MNMLQVQDALKNFSDQQLSGEMSNPSGLAPQFLVMTEMKRRRDMRAQANEQQAPEGTVADELMAQDDGGIAQIGTPDEQEAAQAEADGMADGGVVSLRRNERWYDPSGVINGGTPAMEDHAREVATTYGIEHGLARLGRGVGMAEGGVVRMSNGEPDGGAVQGLETLLAQARGESERREIMRNVQRGFGPSRPFSMSGPVSVPGPGGIGEAEPPSSTGQRPNLRIPDVSEVAPRRQEGGPTVSLGRGNPGLNAVRGMYPNMNDPADSAARAEAEREAGVTSVLGAQERAAQAAEQRSGRQVNMEQQAMRDIRERIAGGADPARAITEAIPGYRGVSEANMRQAFGLPAPATEAAPAQAQATPGAAPGTPAAPGQGPGTEVAPPPDRGGQRSLPGAPGGGGGGGGGGGRGGGASAAGAPGAEPQGGGDLASIIERNRGMFRDRISPLAEQIDANRTDPRARRDEAINMGLIEAGLRIASSRSPTLAGAIGEGGVPALQGYTQQMQQMRQDQRADNRDQLQMALAQNQHDYYLGRISASEMHERNALLMNRNDNATRLQAARIGAGGGGRNPTLEVANWINAAGTPEERDRRLEAAGRDTNQTRSNHNFGQDLSALQQRREQAIAGTLGDPVARRAVEERFDRYERELRQRYPRATGASIPTYSPGENGQPGSIR